MSQKQEAVLVFYDADLREVGRTCAPVWHMVNGRVSVTVNVHLVAREIALVATHFRLIVPMPAMWEATGAQPVMSVSGLRPLGGANG